VGSVAAFSDWNFGSGFELDCFFEQNIDSEGADVPWSRVAALLAINRLCAPGSELAIEQRWYPSTALDDLRCGDWHKQVNPSG
jgi:hypothetical protein